ncbi:MAG TPA: hypothetical protein HA349_08980 [Methanotrichaceae archaeon]|nr:hypothetical protein [Methanotrichaceae archaeon]
MYVDRRNQFLLFGDGHAEKQHYTWNAFWLLNLRHSQEACLSVPLGWLEKLTSYEFESLASSDVIKLYSLRE